MECAAPAAGLEDQGQRHFVVVIDERHLLGELHFLDQGEAALGAALLVAVRGVDQRGQAVLHRQHQLLGEDAILGRRHVVVADLAHRDDAVLLEVARQEIKHALRDRLRVGLLRIQRQRAEVADAELAGAKPLPAEQREEIILEGADVRARLAEPERGAR